MIQRIQSVYLIIAILIQLAQLALTWVTYQIDIGSYAMSGIKSDVPSGKTDMLTVGLSLSIALLLFVLGSFKNRKRQLSFSIFAMILVLLNLAIFAWVHNSNIQLMLKLGAVSINYHLTVVMPLISAVAIFMARSAIKRDEELVRSVDRLR